MIKAIADDPRIDRALIVLGSALQQILALVSPGSKRAILVDMAQEMASGT